MSDLPLDPVRAELRAGLALRGVAPRGGPGRWGWSSQVGRVTRRVWSFCAFVKVLAAVSLFPRSLLIMSRGFLFAIALFWGIHMLPDTISDNF